MSGCAFGFLLGAFVVFFGAGFLLASLMNFVATFDDDSGAGALLLLGFVLLKSLRLSSGSCGGSAGDVFLGFLAIGSSGSFVEFINLLTKFSVSLEV